MYAGKNDHSAVDEKRYNNEHTAAVTRATCWLQVNSGKKQHASCNKGGSFILTDRC
jgi:hypothetical protein